MADPTATLTIYNTDLEELAGASLAEALDGMEVGNSVEPLYLRNLLEGMLGLAANALAEDIEITSGGNWTSKRIYARAIRQGGERVTKLARLLTAAIDPEEVADHDS